MIKILFISDNKINGFGGGSIENKKHYDALKHFCLNNDGILKVISLDTNLPEALGIDVEKNRKKDLKARLFGHSSYIFFTWKKYRNKIIDFNPDIIFLERTRFGFIARDIKKSFPNCKIITNVENVEWDYIDAYFSMQKGLKKILLRAIEKIVVYRDERAIFKYSDQLIFLTEKSVERVKRLYGYNEESNSILPICIESETRLTLKSDKKTLVFIGSLDYESNIEAMIFFIEQVWKKYYQYRKDIQFILAGRNPSEILLESIDGIGNIKIYGNFRSLQEIVPMHSLVLAPIKQGAGMKVKVAETLSMGLMILASDEGLMGYEKVISSENKGIIRANNSGDYQRAIERYLNLNETELDYIGMENLELYHKYYSYNTSRKEIARLCKVALK